MAISWIWAGMVILSLFCGLYTGNLDDVASAALNGAQSAVELSFSMAGVLCLWSGVMEVLNACGLSQKIAGCFHPLLHRLLPQAKSGQRDAGRCLRQRLRQSPGAWQRRYPPWNSGRLPDGPRLRRHRQRRALSAGGAEHRFHPAAAHHSGLHPSAYGSAAPFDILPAVWVSSLASVTVGLLTARFLSRRKRGHL